MASQEWPEPVIRVQDLAESGISSIPERFIKPQSQRPTATFSPNVENINIPIIDMRYLYGGDQRLQKETLQRVFEACRESGFFQVVNHGVSHELMKRAREVWHEFFHQPLEVNEVYANSPTTYEGYRSRRGVQKGVILDWSDYFFLHYMPCSLRDQAKWPALPNTSLPMYIR